MLSKLRPSNSDLFLFLLLDLGHDFDFLLASAILNETMIFHETLTITKTQRMAVVVTPSVPVRLDVASPHAWFHSVAELVGGLQNFLPILGFKCTLP